MSIKINPLSLNIRGYGSNIITKDKTLDDLKNIPYNFICTVQILDDKALVSGFMGILSLSNRREIQKQLIKDYGIKSVKWKRSSKDIDFSKV